MESKQLTFIDYQRKQTTTIPRTPPLASDGRKGRSGGAYRKIYFSGHDKFCKIESAHLEWNYRYW
ncbi:MAG: hypothetical protein NT178_09670 [Proteobacteria bacterium]|nr:hypothetical protein [Pseudomonadota bacterium]